MTENIQALSRILLTEQLCTEVDISLAASDLCTQVITNYIKLIVQAAQARALSLVPQRTVIAWPFLPS